MRQGYENNLTYDIKKRIPIGILFIFNMIKLFNSFYGAVFTTPKVYNCSIVGDSLPPAGSKVIPKA